MSLLNNSIKYHEKFNFRMGLNAYDVLLNASNLEMYIMPAYVALGLEFTEDQVLSELSDHGIQSMIKRRWHEVVIERGINSWVMWDVGIIQAVNNPEWAKMEKVAAPPENTRDEIVIYKNIDSEKMVNDFWRKLIN